MSQNKPDLQLKEISEKLSTLIQISALTLLKDTKSQREKIALLSYAGLQPARIAEILNTTSNTVSKELSVMKSNKKDGKNKKPDIGVEDAGQEQANVSSDDGGNG